MVPRSLRRYIIGHRHCIHYPIQSKEAKYEDDALRLLAKRAIERHTGARGLRAEMEEVMKEIMFDAPDNKEQGKVIVITEEMVRNAA